MIEAIYCRHCKRKLSPNEAMRGNYCNYCRKTHAYIIRLEAEQRAKKLQDTADQAEKEADTREGRYNSMMAEASEIIENILQQYIITGGKLRVALQIYRDKVKLISLWDGGDADFSDDIEYKITKDDEEKLTFGSKTPKDLRPDYFQ